MESNSGLLQSCMEWEGKKKVESFMVGGVCHWHWHWLLCLITLCENLLYLFSKWLFPLLLHRNVIQVSQSWAAGSIGASRLRGYAGTLDVCECEIQTDQDKRSWKADHKVDLERNVAYCCSASFLGERKCWIWKCLWTKGRTSRREPEQQPGLQLLLRHNSVRKATTNHTVN